MTQFLNEALSFIKVLLITIVRLLGYEAAWLSNISETIKLRDVTMVMCLSQYGRGNISRETFLLDRLG